MGLKSTGSNPVFPSIGSFSDSLVINNINLSVSKKRVGGNKLIYTKRNLLITNLLKHLGLLNNVSVIQNKQLRKMIIYSAFFYKNSTFFTRLRGISTPTKKYYITNRALNVVALYLKSTVFIVSTSKGLMTHHQAIRCGLGGLILFSIY